MQRVSTAVEYYVGVNGVLTAGTAANREAGLPN